MDDDTRKGLAVVLAVVAGFIAWLVVADFVGIYGLFAGFYGGMAAALITYLLVAFWGRKKPARKADDSSPGSSQDES